MENDETDSKQKEEKARAITGQSTNTTVKPDKRGSAGEKKNNDKKVSGDNAGNTSNNDSNNGKNEYYLGLPIC